MNEDEVVRQKSLLAVDVRGCSRCGGAHDALRFEPLLNPDDVFEYWGSCPNTGQPILLRVVVRA